MQFIIVPKQQSPAGAITMICFVAMWGLLLIAGCETIQSPPTVPVQGEVVFEGADPNILVGQKIEFALIDDPTVRAFAEIQPDGTFELATLHEGGVWPGAKEGTYRVRLVLADDDLEKQKAILKQIDPNVLSYQKSPWELAIPASDPLVIAVKRR